MSGLDAFALGGRQDDDAALTAAETEMQRLLDEGLGLNEDDIALKRRWDRIEECDRPQHDAAGRTLVGCGGKSPVPRELQEVGMEAGDQEDD